MQEMKSDLCWEIAASGGCLTCDDAERKASKYFYGNMLMASSTPKACHPSTEQAG
jgi:hypothetical protein